MYIKKLLLFFFFTATVSISVFSQTHLAVPLGDPVYYILEQAEMRGLCRNLPRVKPYSRSLILSTIEEILFNDESRKYGALTQGERNVLEQFKKNLTPARDGLDLIRGTYSGDDVRDNTFFSWELGFGLDLTFAGGYYPVASGYTYDKSTDDDLFEYADHVDAGDFYNALDIAAHVSFKGDLGRSASYGFGLSFRVLKSPRTVLGKTTNTYGWLDTDPPNTYDILIYSEPLTYFPFSYKKTWDAHLYSTDKLTASGQLSWPDNTVIGYNMIPELSGTFLNNHILYRVARLDREWAGMTTNSSLVLNQSAQPFLAIEVTIMPFNWITISSLTGVLEFEQGDKSKNDNKAYLQENSNVFQNAYSIVMLELDYKNYFHIGFGSTVVWPKRFELAYPFPFIDNFIYQNNIGDWDNMALFLNLQGQYPGIGRLWFSFFVDEFNPLADRFFEKDRNMYAFQFGSSTHIPWLPFTSFTITYTKNEPFNYTHIRREKYPWYGDTPMETNYVNFGKSLGHYIPPNSDEILIRIETMPVPQSIIGLQYQLIRRGADYGDSAVDGSSLWSELDPGSKRSDYSKFFLRDGAYQWMNIIRLRGEYSLTVHSLPVSVFCEVGGVYSYFTNVDGKANAYTTGSNTKPRSYKRINTPQYPETFSIIGVLGISIFPK